MSVKFKSRSSQQSIRIKAATCGCACQQSHIYNSNIFYRTYTTTTIVQMNKRANWMSFVWLLGWEKRVVLLMGEALGHQKYFWGMQAEKSPARKFFLQTCGFEMRLDLPSWKVPLTLVDKRNIPWLQLNARNLYCTAEATHYKQGICLIIYLFVGSVK